MTPEQWSKLEAALVHPYARARIKADGHVLTLRVQPIKGLRYGVVVYIDGVLDWKASISPAPDAPERKFWRVRKSFLHSAKRRSSAESMAKKRGTSKDTKACFMKIATAGFEMLDPYWTSAKPLCRHLRKTCTEIELLPAFDDADTAEAAQ